MILHLYFSDTSAEITLVIQALFWGIYQLLFCYFSKSFVLFNKPLCVCLSGLGNCYHQLWTSWRFHSYWSCWYSQKTGCRCVTSASRQSSNLVALHWSQGSRLQKHQNYCWMFSWWTHQRCKGEFFFYFMFIHYVYVFPSPISSSWMNFYSRDFALDDIICTFVMNVLYNVHFVGCNML